MSWLSTWWQQTNFSRPCPKTGYYDVFLSFRGIDTRYGFTSYLYNLLQENKVYTFMDVNLTGEDIDYLFKIVEKSRMAVVIYSESFTSSDWCLKELELILQRRTEKKMLIIPIFYNVDVHELKHPTEKTVECFDKHISKYGETTVQKWKEVVTNLGNVSGLSYKSSHGRCEYDFTMEVIIKIKKKLGECNETQKPCIVKPHSEDIRTRDNLIVRRQEDIGSSSTQLSYAHDLLLSYAEPEKDFSACFRLSKDIGNYVGLMKGLVFESPVTSIDMHPTKPWILLTLSRGRMYIWNYKTRAKENSFKVDAKNVFSAKFVHEKNWIVVGSTNPFVHVFNYNTSENVKTFKAHDDTISCLVIHPTSPYVLTTSYDKTVKLWNWENDWSCTRTFEGHSHYVYQVAFNPKDSRSFASVSEDETIKLWSFDSSFAKFTINAHARGLNCVEYFVGNDDKLYLLSGSNDYSVRIWDYESKKLVKTLEGHSREVHSTLVHPKLPIIITGSIDKTVRLWNKNTHRLESVWKSDLGRVHSINVIKASNEVVLGCEDGMVVIEIVNARTPLQEIISLTTSLFFRH